MTNRYRGELRTIDELQVAELEDTERGDRVSIVPSIGNIAYDFLSAGTPVLWSPEGSAGKLKEKKGLAGIPLLAPWANRLEGDTYQLGNGEHTIDRSLGNIRRDANGRPIHGLMLFEPWQVVSLKDSPTEAELICRFDFSAKADFLAQFPLAHHYEMTHTLKDGRLTVRLKVTNESGEMMPLAAGFHPYFSLGSAVRQDVRVRIAARKHLELSDQLLPTGKLLDWNGAAEFELGNLSFDDGFVDLIRDADETAVFEASFDNRKLRVGFGPRFEVAVVYAPPTKSFICFEPMTAVTNAFNSDGKAAFSALPKLQWIPSGGQWEEQFWVELI